MAYGLSSSPLTGSIEVICGPMFSGKTEELIRRVNRARIARQPVQIFKPKLDNRYHECDVVSHSARKSRAYAIENADEIFEQLHDTTRVVAIDEVQFFSDNVIETVLRLSKRGIRVILAGLDQDYLGRPFGPMGEILAIADSVNKIQAICTVCGAAATKTFRKMSSNHHEQVLVGESDHYEARCRWHYDAEMQDTPTYQSKTSLEEIGLASS